jgi:N-acetylglucosamine-6-sulfatase
VGRPHMPIGLSILVLAVTFGLASCNPAKPNIVVVMTDDQTAESIRFMPRVRELLGEQGTTFTNSLVSYSLCCPSRSTFLTGQYAHNHGVQGNDPPHGGYTKLDHSNTLPVWLQQAGYTTTLVGKYLNGYGLNDPNQRPPGWSEWYALVGRSTYYAYDYEMNRNGELVQYGSAPEDYQTDVLADDAVDAIERRSAGSSPFFLWVTPLAPHRQPTGGPIKPAPRHLGIYDDLPLPRPPNFNEADVSDKPAFVRQLPKLTPAKINEIAIAYRREAESLLAVDEMVGRMYDALRESGELDNTIFVFASDNGFSHGEHRYPTGKVRVYDDAVRVPLIVRGDGFTAGQTVTEPVINVDLAPTILELSRATPGLVMDGRSLLDRDPSRPLLFEAQHSWNPYFGVQSGKWLWVEYTNGERELYDMVADPYQLSSRHKDPSLAGVRRDLTALLAEMRTCTGAGCLEP